MTVGLRQKPTFQGWQQFPGVGYTGQQILPRQILQKGEKYWEILGITSIAFSFVHLCGQIQHNVIMSLARLLSLQRRRCSVIRIFGRGRDQSAPMGMLGWGRHQSLATQQQNIMNIFDRNAKRLQRDRTAALPDYEVYDYLKEEVGYRLFDRVCDIKRTFGTAVELGSGRGYVSRHLTKDMVDLLYQCEMSEKLLQQSVIPEVPTCQIQADEELFPFKENSLDLVMSSLSLHWVNNLPGCFKRVHDALKPDGVFVGSLFGGDTLYQLRVVLQLAETEMEGGFGPHISPFTSIQDLGSLLNAAGFNMLTIDVDDFVINYPSISELMTDLKGMGENNCAWSRKSKLHRRTVQTAAKMYKDMYGHDNGVPATYNVMSFIGWKPDPSQMKAAKRGSGTVSLKDLDKLDKFISEAQDRKTDSDRQAQDSGMIIEKLDRFVNEIQNKHDIKAPNDDKDS